MKVRKSEMKKDPEGEEETMGDPVNVASEDEKGMKTEKCGIYDKEGGMGFGHQGVLGFDSRGSRPATLSVGHGLLHSALKDR